jgi:acetolactate synthase I/II/III large subunit
MIKVSDVVAEFLKHKQIDTVFGIIGSANSHIFDSIQNLGYTKIICTHHEQAAIMAMAAYYRASGKLSAAIVTAGAGASNAITGIVSNWADSIPGFILSGQEPSTYLNIHKNLRMYGTQGFSAYEMVKNVTKYSNVLTNPNLIQTELETLYNISVTGRPGPTWLDIPLDSQAKKVKLKDFSNYSNKSLRITDAYNHANDIIKLINESKRPLILGGMGIKLSGAKNKFKQFINTTQIPTTLSWSGIDLLPTNHLSNYGRFGLYGQRAANFIAQNADLIVVLGSRLALPQVGYDFSQFARGAKIVVVDIDELELNKYERTIKYNHDVSLVLDKLLENITKIKPNISEWKSKCDYYRNEYPIINDDYKNDKYVNSYSFVNALTQQLSDDEIIVTDMGTGLLSGHQSGHLKENQTMFTSQGLGEMGVGLPYAIGAAFAEPNKQITCLNCDGGIMMNLQELQTIIQHNLPVKIFVFNNDGYLMIKHTQKLFFQGRYNAVDKNTGIVLPEFERIAYGFKIPYARIDKIEDLDTINLDYKGPVIIEVFMDPEQNFIPKVKGVILEDESIFAPPLEEMSPLLPFETIQKEMIVDISEKSKQIKR